MFLSERSNCHFISKGTCAFGKTITCKPCLTYIKSIPNLDRQGHISILLAKKSGRYSILSICVSLLSFIVALIAFLVATKLIS